MSRNLRRNLLAVGGVIAVLLVGVSANAEPPLPCRQDGVPDPAPKSRYKINASSNEAYDTKTGLTWKRCAVGQGDAHVSERGCGGPPRPMTWDKAVRQGDGVWRLPSVEELKTLLRPELCGVPHWKINDVVFPNNYSEIGGQPWYWTRTEFGARDAWAVRFSDGVTYSFNSYLRTVTLAVRLVRVGQ